jgi:hypothetical protein
VKLNPKDEPMKWLVSLRHVAACHGLGYFGRVTGYSSLIFVKEGLPTRTKPLVRRTLRVG